MQRRFQLVCTVVLAAGLAVAQSSTTSAAEGSAGANVSAPQNGETLGVQQSTQATAASPQGSAALAQGTAFDVTLTKSVDAKKAKQGDEVVAKANRDVKSGGKVVIAKGSKVVGHITEAAAKSKENGESKLGIVFDKAISKGQEVPVHATISSIMAVQATPIASASADDNMGAQSGGAYPSQAGMSGPRGGAAPGGVVAGAARGVGGVGQAAGNTVGDVRPIGDVAAGAGAEVGATASGAVQGLPGVALAHSAQGGAVLSSSSHNVKLDGGTQLMLTVTQ